MDAAEIRKLMDMMLEKGFSKLHIKDASGEEISLETQGAQVYAQPGPVMQQHAAPPPQPSEPQEASGTYITSPMVGTFYTSPAPDAAPFIKVGDAVSADTVVCIVEAMKVMNEVKAGVAGVVKEILVESGHPVEFGTKLYRVE